MTTVLKENQLVDELQKMVVLPEIKKVFTLAFEQVSTVDEKPVRNLKQFIVLTFENKQVRIWELTVSLLTELDRSEFEDQFGDVEEVIKISDQGFAVVGENSVTLVDFEFEQRRFKIKEKSEFDQISKVVSTTKDQILLMENIPNSNLHTLRSISTSSGQPIPMTYLTDQI